MDGRRLLGVALVAAGCLPADDMKGYSGGAESPAGAGATTGTVADTTSAPSSPPASSVSDGTGTGSAAPGNGETAVDATLDLGPSPPPGDGSGAATPSGGGADDGAAMPGGDDEEPPVPSGAEGDPEPPAAPVQFRFVRLVADSAVQGPYTSIAEFNVLDGDGAIIDRASWSASADSEETIFVGGAGAHYAIDGVAISMWHTAWFEVDPPPSHPHTLEIDMGSLHDVSGFRYLGRQDGSLDGRIAEYRFFVSVDGAEWGAPVAAGTLADSAEEQEVRLP
jgi:hypothetical protein